MLHGIDAHEPVAELAADNQLLGRLHHLKPGAVYFARDAAIVQHAKPNPCRRKNIRHVSLIGFNFSLQHTNLRDIAKYHRCPEQSPRWRPHRRAGCREANHLAVLYKPDVLAEPHGGQPAHRYRERVGIWLLRDEIDKRADIAEHDIRHIALGQIVPEDAPSRLIAIADNLVLVGNQNTIAYIAQKRFKRVISKRYNLRHALTSFFYKKYISR